MLLGTAEDMAMRLGRIVVGSLVGAALVAGSVTPAMARDGRWDRGYGRGWGGYGHHHRGNGFGFGDAVGVAALIGAVAIVASSMKKDSDSRNPSNEGDNSVSAPADSRDGAGHDNGEYAANSSKTYPGGPSSGGGGSYSDKGDIANEDAAVDACAVAAREEASANGTYAEVRDIGNPQPVNGGWNIDGSVEQRTGYRNGNGKVRRFTCTVKDGRVAEVYLSRDPATT
jgi:hypothetical protein